MLLSEEREDIFAFDAVKARKKKSTAGARKQDTIGLKLVYITCVYF